MNSRKWFNRFLGTFGLALSVVIFFAAASIATAALTFSGTSITGDSGVVIDSSSTISIGASSSTGITIGRSGITAIFPGSVTINGNATTTSLIISGISGSTQCLHVNANGIVTGTGSDCGSASGSVTSSSIASAGGVLFDASGTVEAPIYPTTYIVTVLLESDLHGPKSYTSIDGVNLNAITKPNGVDLYTDNVAFRDPRLMKAGNTYLLSYTNNTSNSGSGSGQYSIGLAESTDMQKWTKITTPNWSSYFSGDQNSIWQGTWYFDASSSVYYMYFATADWGSSATPYYVTFNPSTNTFGTPQEVSLGSSRTYADVTAVWKVGSTYYGLLQSNGTGGGDYVELIETSSLSGTWTIAGANNWAGWGTSIEAGEELTLPNGTYQVYFMPLGGGSLYYSTSSNLASWSTATAISGFSNADYVGITPFNDMQTDEVLNAIRNGESSGSSGNWSTSGSTLYYTGGDIGIGTASPNYELEVAGTNASTIIHLTSNNDADSGGYLQSGDSSSVTLSGGAVYTGSWVAKNTVASELDQNNGTLTFYSNSGLTPGSTFTLTPRFTVASSGYVGIGTTTSTQLLTVAGTSSLQSLLIPSLTGTQCLHEINGVVSGTGSDCGSGGGASASGTINTATADQFAYYASNGTSISGQSVLNLSGSDIGIDTTTPAAALDVAGQGYFNSDIVARSGTLAFPSNMTGFIGGYDGGQNRSFFYSGVISSGVATTREPLFFDGSTFQFTNAGTSQAGFNINSLGNVGIGTTAPSTTLQVAGASSTIRIGTASLPGCLEMGNSNGTAGINYITVLNGVLSATTTNPGNCQ